MKALNKRDFAFLIYTILFFVWMSSTVRTETRSLCSIKMSKACFVVGDTLKEKVFDYVEQLPEFPGGMAAFHQYLAKNIRYPNECKQIIGKVFVSFIVTKIGKLEHVDAKAGDCQALRQGLITIIRNMPDWKPGKHQGKPVNVRYSMPIYICMTQQ